MTLNARQISEHIGVTPRYVRNLTKKASDTGTFVVHFKGESYSFRLVSGTTTRGKAYSYQRIQQAPATPKRKVKRNITLNPNDIPAITDLDNPTTEEKLELISFYNASGHPLGHIVNALIMRHRSAIQPASLQAKVKRWGRSFKEKGRAGLEDKRGGKGFKADLELVQEAILGAGNIHNVSLYGFYCHLYAERNNLPINYKKPCSDISESAFSRSVKHLVKTRPLLKDYLHLGMDAYVYSEPSFGRQWEYFNQQWEVDATPLDIMAKVPHNSGIRDYLSRDKEQDYHLVRSQLIRVIDNFSGASVCGLFESSNSYANVRLIYKALAILGKPEVIKGDNGGDYVSVHMQDVLADIGIDYIATGKARGDGKGKIERSFRTLQHSAEFEVLAGFIGHNIAQRQKLEGQASTKLEKLSGVQTNIKGDFMWWWELENWIDNFIAHKEQHKLTQHTPATEAELTKVFRSLGKKTSKTVSKEGIRHRNTHFTSFDMWNDIAIGDSVEITEHVNDSTLLFLFKDGEFIGEIEDKKMFRQGKTVEELKSNKKAYKQRVVNDMKKATKQAQKNFKGYQNHMRDEYLDNEVKTAANKKKTEKQEQQTGVSSIQDYIQLAQKAG